MLNSTELSTAVIPNFRAYAAIDSLRLPFTPADNDFLNVRNVQLELIKDETGLRGSLNGDVYFLGANFGVDGQFSIHDDGLFGVLDLDYNSGAFLSDFGLNLDGDFLLEINTTGVYLYRCGRQFAVAYRRCRSQCRN